MSNDQRAAANDPAEDELIRIVRALYPDGPDDSDFWSLLAQPAETKPSDSFTSRALARAHDALASAESETTLGQYLSRLRKASGTSLARASEYVRLSTTVIQDLELDDCKVSSVQAPRLAKLAVLVGASKTDLLRLVSEALSLASRSPVVPARLTRLDSRSSQLSAERAKRRSAARSAVDPEVYLSELSSAFDQASRTRQA